MNWNDYFTCDASAGRLYFKHRPQSMFATLRGYKVWNAQNARREVGCPNHAGYLMVRVNKRLFLVHRIIWTMTKGSIPDGMEVDHINTVKADNRITNMRLATHSQNGWNKGKPRTNTSGYKGVTLHKGTGRWAAQLSFNGQHIHLGLHDKPEDAALAYIEASASIHGSFSRT